MFILIFFNQILPNIKVVWDFVKMGNLQFKLKTKRCWDLKHFLNLTFYLIDSFLFLFFFIKHLFRLEIEWMIITLYPLVIDKLNYLNYSSLYFCWLNIVGLNLLAFHVYLFLYGRYKWVRMSWIKFCLKD